MYITRPILVAQSCGHCRGAGTSTVLEPPVWPAKARPYCVLFGSSVECSQLVSGQAPSADHHGAPQRGQPHLQCSPARAGDRQHHHTASVQPTRDGSLCSTNKARRAGKRRSGPFSATRAHTKAPYKSGLLWRTLGPLRRPGGPGPCAAGFQSQGALEPRRRGRWVSLCASWLAQTKLERCATSGLTHEAASKLL